MTTVKIIHKMQIFLVFYMLLTLVTKQIADKPTRVSTGSFADRQNIFKITFRTIIYSKFPVIV